MKSVIIIAIAFVLLIPVGMSYAEPETLDFENCEGILDVEEIKSTINHIEEITVNSRSLMAVDVSSSLLSMCDSTFESQGKSISMTIVVMQSSEAASSLYQQNLDEFFSTGNGF